MSNVAVVGTQWGDEGKGKIVDWLSEGADVVVRYQGGHNAGHTIVVNGVTYKLSLLPSGIVRPSTLSVIGNGVVLDPWAFVEEVDRVGQQGVPVTPERLRVAENCCLILPYHGELDRARESQDKRRGIGTTGRGIGPAYEDKVARRAIRLCDLSDEDELGERLDIALAHHDSLRNALGLPSVDKKATIAALMNVAPRLLPYQDAVWRVLHRSKAEGAKILFEGARGAMLDVDHGTYPYVTSSNPTSGGISTGLGFPGNKIDDNIGIFKVYTTRVGEGPFPTELNDKIGQKIREVGSEFGATTGRPRRCGWFDAVAARYSCRLNGLTKIALTKLDILDGFKEILICNSYKINGIEYSNFSEAQFLLDKVEPVFEHFPGWDESTYGIKSFEDLPENAKKYIILLSNMLETPIKIISTGPKRNQIISM